MNKAALLAVATISIVTPSPCDAASQLPGSELWNICKDGISSRFYGPACAMYVAGVWDALWLINREQKSRGEGGWCVPDKAEAIGLMQLTDIVALYLRDNPQLRDYSAGPLVMEAIREELC